MLFTKFRLLLYYQILISLNYNYLNYTGGFVRVWVMESERCIYGFKGMVCLTDKEYRLFSSLLKKGCNGNVLSRDELISDVWPERHGVIGKNDIHQLSFRLRKKLIVINEGFKVGLVDGSGFSIHRPQSIIAYHLDSSCLLVNVLKMIYKVMHLFKYSSVKEQ